MYRYGTIRAKKNPFAKMAAKANERMKQEL